MAEEWSNQSKDAVVTVTKISRQQHRTFYLTSGGTGVPSFLSHLISIWHFLLFNALLWNPTEAPLQGTSSPLEHHPWMKLCFRQLSDGRSIIPEWNPTSDRREPAGATLPNWSSTSGNLETSRSSHPSEVQLQGTLSQPRVAPQVKLHFRQPWDGWSVIPEWSATLGNLKTAGASPPSKVLLQAASSWPGHHPLCPASSPVCQREWEMPQSLIWLNSHILWPAQWISNFGS